MKLSVTSEGARGQLTPSREQPIQGEGIPCASLCWTLMGLREQSPPWGPVVSKPYPPARPQGSGCLSGPLPPIVTSPCPQPAVTGPHLHPPAARTQACVLRLPPAPVWSDLSRKDAGQSVCQLLLLQPGCRPRTGLPVLLSHLQGGARRELPNLGWKRSLPSPEPAEVAGRPHRRDCAHVCGVCVSVSACTTCRVLVGRVRAQARVVHGA